MFFIDCLKKAKQGPQEAQVPLPNVLAPSEDFGVPRPAYLGSHQNGFRMWLHGCGLNSEFSWSSFLFTLVA